MSFIGWKLAYKHVVKIQTKIYIPVKKLILSKATNVQQEKTEKNHKKRKDRKTVKQSKKSKKSGKIIEKLKENPVSQRKVKNKWDCTGDEEHKIIQRKISVWSV